jgi:hypothetical protein
VWPSSVFNFRSWLMPFRLSAGWIVGYSQERIDDQRQASCLRRRLLSSTIAFRSPREVSPRAVFDTPTYRPLSSRGAGL